MAKPLKQLITACWTSRPRLSRALIVERGCPVGLGSGLGNEVGEISSLMREDAAVVGVKGSLQTQFGGTAAVAVANWLSQMHWDCEKNSVPETDTTQGYSRQKMENRKRLTLLGATTGRRCSDQRGYGGWAWAYLSGRFPSHFASSIPKKKQFATMCKLEQSATETLTDYLTRWKEAKSVENFDEKATVTLFHALDTPTKRHPGARRGHEHRVVPAQMFEDFTQRRP
nr:uncharacterized protein LOC109164065 [Ipomoea batatas]